MENKPATVDDLTAHLEAFMTGLDAKFMPLARLAKCFWAILVAVVVMSFAAGSKATETIGRIARLEQKQAANDEMAANVVGLTEAVNGLKEQVKTLNAKAMK